MLISIVAPRPSCLFFTYPWSAVKPWRGSYALSQGLILAHVVKHKEESGGLVDELTREIP